MARDPRRQGRPRRPEDGIPPAEQFQAEVERACRHARRDDEARAVGADAYIHTNQAGQEVFRVIHDVPPFIGGREYTKFQVYALLHHGGDEDAAAKALKRLDLA